MIMSASIRTNINPNKLEKTCRKVEHDLAIVAERDTRPYIPAEDGRLRNSGKVVNNYIVWDTPYAKVQYFGNVYVDPIKKVGGFRRKDGTWFSRPNVTKLRSNRKFKHPNGGGDMWFFRAKEANRAKWLRVAERGINDERK